MYSKRLGKTPSYGKKLTSRARSYLDILRKAGVRGGIVSDSYREYSVKVDIFYFGKPLGKVVIYYSPKINCFTPVFQEVTAKEWVPLLEDAWRGKLPARVPGSVESRESEVWAAYVDGSYHRGKTGYGAVILKNDQPVEEFSGRVPPEFSHSRQVGGELFAVYEVIRYCLAKGIEELIVYYDYYGIEKWAIGKWKTNLPLTQNYASFVRESPVRIVWVKVRGHSGDRWNERADQLARQGTGP